MIKIVIRVYATSSSNFYLYDIIFSIYDNQSLNNSISDMRVENNVK